MSSNNVTELKEINMNIDYYKKSFVQWSYIKTYKKFVSNRVFSNDHVLDIGSGYGFLKPLIGQQKAIYRGIEPITDIYDSAVYFYGQDGFENSMLYKNTEAKHYDKIFSLTVLDEVPNKYDFLDNLKSYAHEKTDIFLAVRNSKFPFRNSPTVFSSVDCIEMPDLSYDHWFDFLNGNGFSVMEVGKFPRPLISSFKFRPFINNILLWPLYFILPIKKSYMIFFVIRVDTQ